ncbi:Tim44/TimA family putative adaptor protein [Sphingosinithalassobacter portus]|uniref:Tim44/TimA family putative adaptor protein n=1 Tax=Stakelama portus TaxID=2676234 RepID=UPI0011AB4092|nr:Tim44/TimA family putative adaptor protein [Sphingosinithalassobacter portus]
MAAKAYVRVKGFGGVVSTFYIVLFAMVAAFLALRLYSVLGKRTGHEQQPLPKAAEERAPAQPMPRTIDMAPEAREPGSRNVESDAEPGLRAVIAADSSFDVAQFIDGAKSAYEMILKAFWSGDEETLKWLVEDDVREGFSAAIAERKEAGHTLDNRLVSIETAKIVDAQVEGRNARITVRFDADIAAVTRDADGNVVAGSMSDAVETHDIWTFARTLRSDDPNWKLAETDEA